MASNNIAETVQQIQERIEAQKAAARAEQERILAPLRKAAEERQAANLKAKQDAQQARESQRQAEAAEQFDREHKRGALSAWLANGGSEQEFDEAWPRLRQDLLLEATRQQQNKARTATAQHMRQVF